MPALQGGHVVSRSPAGLWQGQARAHPWMGGGFLAFLGGRTLWPMLLAAEPWEPASSGARAWELPLWVTRGQGPAVCGGGLFLYCCPLSGGLGSLQPCPGLPLHSHGLG